MTTLPQLVHCTSFEQFKSFMASPANREADMAAFEAKLLGGEAFTVRGYCAVCDQTSAFFVDYESCVTTPDGRRVPNWRERLVCPHCGLSNRMRAAVSFLLSKSNPSEAIYLTEFITPLFRAVASRRAQVVGSEFLRDGTMRGSTNSAGIRHEDVTSLTFPNAAFRAIGTFDVLEHVPNYRQALAEFFRCLRPGGTLIITVPFLLWSPATITRATVDASGMVTHLLPPELHGDPADHGGALCYYHFGWDFLDALSATGFGDVDLSMYWDAQLGYLGGYQFMITARKPAAQLRSP